MDLETYINKFIEIKKKQFELIDNIRKISKRIRFTEYEKLTIYRELVKYKKELQELADSNKLLIVNDKHYGNIWNEDNIIEIDMREYPHILNSELVSVLSIDDDQYFRLTSHNLIYLCQNDIKDWIDLVFYKDSLYSKPIYVFNGYYSRTYNCDGPVWYDEDDDLEAKYQKMNSYDTTYIKKDKMEEFEKNKTILSIEDHVSAREVINIFDSELLNENNTNIDDCINATRKRIKDLNYERSPEYKKKALLEKIKKLHDKVKGEYLESKKLYNGDFIDIINETYRLPNNKVVNKEKIVKNNGKDSVVVIAKCDDKYILVLQNRMKDVISVEFPAGYIEDGEEVLESANRELLEETSYSSNDLSIIDEVYTSPGIDNSKTYIVLAYNCYLTNKKTSNGSELVTCGLFDEDNLDYLIDNNIMNGSLSKLSYYKYKNMEYIRKYKY